MRLKALVVSALLLGAFLVSPVLNVYAQVNDTPEEPEQTEDIDETEVDEDEILYTTQGNEGTGAQDSQKTPAERKQDRKDRFADKVDSSRKNRVAARCAGAQGLLQGASDATDTIRSNRSSAHQRLVSRLNNIVERLSGTEVDTALLQEEIVTLQGMIETFDAKFEEHQTALADALALDCEADTESFLLAIEEAKSLRKDLRALAKEIREYVVDTIISTLNDIKTSLVPADTADAVEENQ